jgi:glutamine cyclotransferase
MIHRRDRNSAPDLMTPIRFARVFTITAILIAAAACSDSTSPTPRPAPPPDTTTTMYTYTIIQQYPHDPGAFTQGLVYVDSLFIEGTGLYGESTLRRVEVETGNVIQRVDLPASWFGEGVAVWGDTIVQLTYQANTAIVYNTQTFDEIGYFHYGTEGWGLTHDANRYIMSDGSSTLYFRDRFTFAEVGRVRVFDDTGAFIDRLNELEYIDGFVYANRWKSTWIAKIDPETGRVRGWIDTSGLEHTNSNVTNGIAYDADNDRLFVTGKRWQHVYEIELVEQPSGQ